VAEGPVTAAGVESGNPLRRTLRRLTRREAFPGLVLATFVLFYVNIASGALVRVTDSGLGCPDWPLCNGRPVPAAQGHALIEFSNRLVALALIVTAALLAVSARRWYRRSHPGWFWMAVAVGVGTAAQAPLGAVTVLLDLNPLAVMAHFLLAIVLFAIATVLLVDVRGTPDPRAARPRWLAPAALGLTAWCLALIVSGAVVTTSGTHPGDADVPRLWNLLDATYVHVRIAVSYVIALAAFLFLVARLDPPPRRVPRLAWLVVGATALQVGIGELQWRTELPAWLVLLHVSVAAALWASVVALARSLVAQPAGAQPSSLRPSDV
jgi:cytochrome c oxidase assembly protein subunit 15